MTDLTPVTEKITQWMNGFGGPTEIAKFLEGQGIYGVRTDSEFCPLAIYIRRAFLYGDLKVNVRSSHLSITEGGDGCCCGTGHTKGCGVNLTGPMAEFVELYDSGMYENLSA